MLNVIDADDEQQACCYDVHERDDPAESIEWREREENQHEYSSRDKFDDRILPRYLALALLAGALLGQEAENRDEFLPGEPFPARHALRPSAETDSGVETKRDDIEETADDSAEDEGEEGEIKHVRGFELSLIGNDAVLVAYGTSIITYGFWILIIRFIS